MIWVDYCILAVFVVSTLTGIVRGFVREALGLATWVAAFALAWLFGHALADAMQARISDPGLRLAAAYAVLFLGGLLAGAITTHLISEAVRNNGLASTDRTLGGGLGLLRGVVIVAAFVLVAGSMGAQQDRWWQDSMLIKRFVWVADGLRTLVPQRWLDALQPEKSTAQRESGSASSPAPHMAQFGAPAPGGSHMLQPEGLQTVPSPAAVQDALGPTLRLLRGVAAARARMAASTRGC